MAGVDAMLAKRDVVVACGLGGVGKTTIAASLAVRAALDGRKAVVVTIDPAKRLRTSLGLERLGNDPTDLSAALRAAAARHPSRPEVRGELHAVVPDTRQTFESFVRSLSSSREQADRVLRNPVFQVFAQEFSGANEYMALERLHELHESGRFDCVVLDTPPSRDTLAFLEAPALLSRLFDEKIIRWLILPANRLVSAAMRTALGALEKLTGSHFMSNLVDFASSLFEVRARFTANLDRITELLKSPRTGFVLVTAPAPESAPEAAHFVGAVRSHGFAFEGVIVNRTLGPLAGSAGASAGGGEALRLVRRLAERDDQAVRGIHEPLLAVVPELARDVHGLDDLLAVALALEETGGR